MNNIKILLKIIKKIIVLYKLKNKFSKKISLIYVKLEKIFKINMIFAKLYPIFMALILMLYCATKIDKVFWLYHTFKLILVAFRLMQEVNLLYPLKNSFLKTGYSTKMLWIRGLLWLWQ